MGNIIEWLESDSVGIPAIDEDHKRLVLLANELMISAFSGDKEDKEHLIVQGLSELIMFTQDHFAREEEYMRRNAASNLEAHKKQHAEIVEKLFDLNNKLRKGELDIVEVSTFLMDWLYSHMRGVDHTDLIPAAKAPTG